MLGKIPWNRGKKFPHSPEWEAKRLAAVRNSAAAKDWPRGYKRPTEYTQPMLDAVKKYRKQNPDQCRVQAMAALPKDTNGEKNGNWKGGITAKTRGIRFSKDYKQWRKIVLDRDGHKCKICGDMNRLHAHHIISMSECGIIATLPMNGVTLCPKCHYQNDEVWKGKRFSNTPSSGRASALIFTIPHKFQAYSTVGNWQFTKDGTIVIFVSKLSDERFEMLIALHEFAEVLICKHRGITTKSVDAFDKAFEAARTPDNEDEPGDEPSAPYVKEHCIATGIERIMAAELDVSWKEYEEELSKLP